MFFENIKMALRNFVTNKMRTILSLLGIVIGVSSVILITTLGNSAKVKIQGEFNSAGRDMVQIYAGWGNGRKQTLFTPELTETLKTNFSEIVAASATYNVNGTAVTNYTSIAPSINLIDPDFYKIFSLEAVSGRIPGKIESEGLYPGVVLGYKMAQQLYPTGGATGSTIRIIIFEKVYQFRVQAVLAQKNGSGININNSVFMDMEYYKKKIDKIGSIYTYYLKAQDADKAAFLAGEIDAYLLENTSGKRSFYVETPSTAEDMFNKVSNILNLVLAGIAAISLLVGGIGIMNIMLVSVTERTREIGIRKALGAPARAIRHQFLTESAALTILGGIQGTLIGFGLGKVITPLLQLPFAPDLRATALAVSFSAAIGLFFGIYPAIRASRLNPIEALSRE